MRKSDGGHRAMEFEAVEASARGRYLNKKLYAVDGVPGLFRRVRDPGVDDAVAVGILPCWFDGGVVYLTPADAETAELADAGFDTPVMPESASVLLMRLHAGLQVTAARPELPPASPPPAEGGMAIPGPGDAFL